MKREFLQNFKVGDQGLSKEIIDAIMEENGKDIENAKSKFADYAALKEQLAAANKTIEEFKGMDIDGIKQAAEEWKQKAEQAENEAKAKIADLEFESTLKEAVSSAKGRNAKAIRALLDVEALKASKNQSEDIRKALEEMKRTNDYLFEKEQTPPPYAMGTGTHGMSGYDPETAAIRAAAGLKNEKE